MQVNQTPKKAGHKMTREEQNLFMNKEYAEAMRYIENAKEALAKARKEDDGFYKDRKYVKTACGVAYNGVLHALDAWFKLKDLPELPKKQRKSVEYYKRNISLLDKKMSARFDTIYNILHLAGYYDGETSVKIIQAGFEYANEIIEKIKPEKIVETKESRASAAKRVFSNMMMSMSVAFS